MLKIILIIMVIIWCIIIFLFSSMNGKKSNGESKKIINKITQKKLKIKTLEKLNKILRKCMHASIFCVLGILIFLCLKSFEIHNWTLSIMSLILSFLYACSDEFHQKFVDGRTALFTDVLIDTAGASIGILVLNIII